MIMKAKFVFLMAAGLLLAAASQAQFPGSYKDGRDVQRESHGMTYERNKALRHHREMRMDKRDLRHDRKQFNKAKRHHHRHHRHSGHRHGHRVA